MLSILKKFFDFCQPEDCRKFYLSIYLGVIKSLIIALRIPAIGLVIMGLIEKNLSMRTFWLSLVIMAISVLLNVWITLKITMLQTEAGYNTCAQKRIEIAQHMRYLPMGYFNQTSLGKITSVTTNTLEALSDVATRVVMMTVQGFLSCALITILVFIFDWRIGRSEEHTSELQSR